MKLAGNHEIAKAAGVQSSVVSNWIKRYEDFPAPVAELRCGRIWDLEKVQKWLEQQTKARSAADASQVNKGVARMSPAQAAAFDVLTKNRKVSVEQASRSTLESLVRRGVAKWDTVGQSVVQV